MYRRNHRASQAAGWPTAVVAMAAILVGFAVESFGDVDPSRFESIVVRNPFALKPIPPPPNPNDTPPPPIPPPQATVELKGIVTGLFSAKKAILDIIPGPGKPMIHPILTEGEKVETVEVVSIDVEKNQVVIKNGTLVTNITFTVAKSGPPMPTQLAGMPPPGIVPGQSVVPVTPVPGANQANMSYNPTGSGRNGVIMTGGNPGYQNPAPNSPTMPANTGGGTVAPQSNPGFRSIPSRTIRSGGLAPQTMPGAAVVPGQPHPEQPQIDPAQAYLQGKAQEAWAKQRGIVMPPQPTVLGVD